VSEAQDRDLEDLLRDVPKISLSRKTINQVVAYNLQTARRARAWTQDELAAKLEDLTDRPWTAATLGAAERSWESGRIRKFDANELVAFSRAFGLPVAYFLLPPEEDDWEERDDEGNRSSGSSHTFSTGVIDDEFRASSHVTVRDLMEALEPFRPPPQFIDRMKRAMLRCVGVDWQPGTRKQQIPVKTEDLTPEEELSLAELALESSRSRISGLAEDLRREREHQLHLAERVGRAKRRVERQQSPVLPELVEIVKGFGRERIEQEIATMAKRFEREELIERGWPHDYRKGEPIHHSVILELEVAAQTWPDLEPVCSEVIENIHAAEKWWKQTGMRQHDLRIRDLFEGMEDDEEAPTSFASGPPPPLPGEPGYGDVPNRPREEEEE
jgi:transcriptional regulator with XRE-family HTH domain